MRIISIANQKGGVGKTTTAQAMAAGLASKGFKVLAIDLDPQGNFSVSSNAENVHSDTAKEVLKKEVGIVEAVQAVEGNYDIVPSNIMLASAEQEIVQIGRNFLLKEALEAVEDKYDFVVIDTPPNLGILTVNALTASDHVIIPTTADVFAVQGISELTKNIKQIKKYYNQNISIAGILFTQYNGRTKISQDMEEIAEELSKLLGVSIFKTKIRSAVAVREAQAHRKDIFEYAKKSAVSEDYSQFVEEYLLCTK